MIELIDRNRLREMLVREQAKYIMSDYKESKHISAGFLLAIAELDSMPTIMVLGDKDETDKTHN